MANVIDSKGFKVKIKQVYQRVAMAKRDAYVMRVDKSVIIPQEDIVDFAARDSGLRREQILAVLMSFEKQVRQMVLNGHYVKLGILGNIGFKLNAHATEQATQAGTAMVYRRTLSYRASKPLAKAWEQVSFELSNPVTVDNVEGWPTEP